MSKAGRAQASRPNGEALISSSPSSEGEDRGGGARRKIKRTGHAKSLARRLRRLPTDAERKLWSRLRRRQLDGLHFRRQSPIGRYVADFLCVDARVIVEVDGRHHTGTRSDHDRKRTVWLESQGYRVIRFSNNGVLEHLDDVLETILARIDEAPPTPSLPL